ARRIGECPMVAKAAVILPPQHPLLATLRFRGLRAAIQPLAVFFLLAMLVFAASRLGLAAWLWARIPGHGLGVVLGRGLRFDLVVVCAVCLLALLPQVLLPSVLLRTAAWDRFLRLCLTGWLMLITFNEAATPSFIREFGVRPNRQYVEYLDTPGLVL